MFNDPELQKAYDQSEAEIADVCSRLDKISSDIKTLSGVLKHSGVGRVIIELPFGKLVWDTNYIMVVFSDDEENGSLVRRLIECPKEIRLKFAPHLKDLIGGMLKNIRSIK